MGGLPPRDPPKILRTSTSTIVPPEVRRTPDTVRKEGFAELRAFLDILWDNSLSSLKRQVEADKGKRRDQK
jgi:hypothetical protein